MTEVRVEEELMGRLRVNFAGNVFPRISLPVCDRTLVGGVVCCGGVPPGSWLLDGGLDASNTSSEGGLPSPFSSSEWKVEGGNSVD